MENHLLVLLLSLLIAFFEAYHAYKLHKTIKTLIVSAKHSQSLIAQNDLSNDELSDNSDKLLDKSYK